MQTRPVTPDDLRQSVIAVPPLARDSALKFCLQENEKIIRHIEKGGVSTLLYGGNANFYHIALSEYESILDGISSAAGGETLVVPAVGPAFGMMMDQAEVLRNFDFPTAMILPQQGLTTLAGVEAGVRAFAEKLGKPVVLYIKFEGFINPDGVKRLVDDGVISWIKYAIVRDDPLNDPYLTELVDLVDPSIIVSGMGEQPVVEHLRDFGITGFTSGCVCIRPDLSAEMLRACQSGDWGRAQEIKQTFFPLEDLRNQINPVRVLHEAVALSGIAETGPICLCFPPSKTTTRLTKSETLQSICSKERSSKE